MYVIEYGGNFVSSVENMYSLMELEQSLKNFGLLGAE
jgi:hypothetical protein